MTFVNLRCSQRAADRYTTDQIEKARASIYESNKHRDSNCKVTVTIEPKDSSSTESFTFMPKNLKLPDEVENYWLETFSLFRFNGVDARKKIFDWKVNNYQQISRNIVRVYQISPNGASINRAEPKMDDSKVSNWLVLRYAYNIRVRDGLEFIYLLSRNNI